MVILLKNIKDLLSDFGHRETLRVHAIKIRWKIDWTNMVKRSVVKCHGPILNWQFVAALCQWDMVTWLHWLWYIFFIRNQNSSFIIWRSWLWFRALLSRATVNVKISNILMLITRAYWFKPSWLDLVVNTWGGRVYSPGGSETLISRIKKKITYDSRWDNTSF